MGTAEIRYAYGVDAIQAVILALEGIRGILETSARQLTWVGEAGNTGFPRIVADLGSPRLRKRIEQLVNREVEREVERFVRALERKHRVRRRPLSKGRAG